MFKFKIPFRNNEIQEFSIIVSALYTNAISHKIFGGDNYHHYYNLKTLFEKIVKKQMQIGLSKKKKYSMSITINEYEALRYIQLLELHQMKIDTYYTVLLDNIFANLYLQKMNCTQLIPTF